VGAELLRNVKVVLIIAIDGFRLADGLPGPGTNPVGRLVVGVLVPESAEAEENVGTVSFAVAPGLLRSPVGGIVKSIASRFSRMILVVN
jgi:hypothetical protein